MLGHAVKLIFLVTPFLSGCGRDPLSKQYTTKYPEAGISGTYVLARHGSDRTLHCRLDVYEDGKFSVTNIPVIVDTVSPFAGFAEPGHTMGHWRIDVAGSVRNYRVWGIGFSAPDFLGSTNYFFGVLTGQATNYTIVFPRGGLLGSPVDFEFRREYPK